MAWEFDNGNDQLLTDGWAGTVFTVQLWWRIDTDRNDYSNPLFVTANSGGGGGLLAGLGTESNGTVMTVFDSAFSLQAAGDPGVGTWYWFCLIANGTSWSVLHGTDPATATVVGPNTRNAVSAPGSLVLGPTAEPFFGDLANLKHWTRALTTSDARAEGATYTLLSSTNVLRHHTMQTSSLANEAGSGAAFTGNARVVVAGPSLLDTTVTGVLSASLQRPTAALVGTVTVPGALAVSLQRPVGNIAGQVTDTGVLAASLPLPLAALTGTVRIPGALAATLPVPVANIAATVPNLGVLDAMLPRPVASIQTAAPPLALPLRAGEPELLVGAWRGGVPTVVGAWAAGEPVLG